MFLKILQNSEENTCAGFSFWRPATLLKQRLRHRCFSVFCRVFESIYFVEHLWTAASEKGSIKSNYGVRSKKIWSNTNLSLVYQPDKNRASGRTFIRGYSGTLSCFNFFIFWSPYCLKYLISRTVWTLNN